MKRFVAIILAVLLAVSFTACGRAAEKPAKKNGLTIYASFYPMQFLAEQIAGDKATVTSLVPAGVEPHDWEPKPRTLAELQQSDLLIYNGAGMEAWLGNLIPSLQKAGVKTVNTSEGLDLIPAKEETSDEHVDEKPAFASHVWGRWLGKLLPSLQKTSDEHVDEKLAYDPHVWVSPANYKKQAQNVLNALVEVDPANQAYYKANYNKMAQQLDKLDSDYRQAAAGFHSKIFVVSHSAFGYLAREYGLTQLPIRGVSPQAEPSPTKMGELAQICRENNVKYIFFESLVSPKLSETLAREVNAQTLVLNDGQGITEEQIKQGKNYITIMYDNLENLKKALM